MSRAKSVDFKAQRAQKHEEDQPRQHAGRARPAGGGRRGLGGLETAGVQCGLGPDRRPRPPAPACGLKMNMR